MTHRFTLERAAGLAAVGLMACATQSSRSDDQPGDRCSTAWAELPALYPDAGTLGSCEGRPEAERITGSLMKIDELVIDNQGRPMRPCLQTRCDADHVYIASNGLPHYDFVPTTPLPLVENTWIYRIPLQPRRHAVVPADADLVSALSGCQEAYRQFLDAPRRATEREPSQQCLGGPEDRRYLAETGADGVTGFFHKLNCLDAAGVMINGVPIYGSNEGPVPNAWGSPAYYLPTTASEPYVPEDRRQATALDLCGAQTADSAHSHVVNEACYARAADGAPLHSYEEAAAQWDYPGLLSGACTAESPVVGWAFDGHPLLGPCVCTARHADGSCQELRRARSSWVYRGLRAWGEDPREANALAAEGRGCRSDADCCAGQPPGACDFHCAHELFEDAASPEGVVADRRCVLLHYARCTHVHVPRSETTAHGALYLDLCNGFTGPDGYRYHATGSFPYNAGCYRGAPSSSLQGARPAEVRACVEGMRERCCGDGRCTGIEDESSCPADC
jgi:hypothetical protein